MERQSTGSEKPLKSPKRERSLAFARAIESLATRSADVKDLSAIATGLESSNCEAIRFLRDWLGCGVLRFFIYDRTEGAKIRLFRDSPELGPWIDPAWSRIESGPAPDGRFVGHGLKQVEQNKLSTAVENCGPPTSAERFFHWHVGEEGGIRTQTEIRKGVFLVAAGEMAVDLFEWSLRLHLTNALQKAQDTVSLFHRSAGRPPERPLRKLLRTEPFVRALQQASSETLAATGYSGDLNSFWSAVRSWLAAVLESDPDEGATSREHLAWFSADPDMRSWFTQLPADATDSATSLHSFDDLAFLILRYGDFSFGPASHRDETEQALHRRLRFNPRREAALKSRNLLWLPLWVGPRLSGPGPKKVPFAAFVLASAYDLTTIEQCMGMFRALLSYMTFPNIREFAISKYELLATRNAQAQIESHLRHALKSRLHGLEAAVDELERETVPRLRRVVGFIKSATLLRGRNAGEVPQRLVRIDLGSIVTRVASSFDDPRIHDTVPTHQVWVYGDREFLTEALTQIVENSCERPSDEVTSIAVSLRVTATTAEIHITDDGPGIADIIKHRLFEPFASYPSDRLGLGLSHARTILVALNGSIEQLDTQKQGVHFLITLPLSQEDHR